MKCPMLVPAVVMLLAGLVPAWAWGIDFGINIHRGGALDAQVAALMQARNFRSARMDLPWDADATDLRDQASRIRANGGTVEVSLQVAFQWDASCSTDLSGIEQQAYAQAVPAIDGVKDLVQDFELLNETQLRPEIQREVPWNSAGSATAPYVDKPCVAALVAALRGMSRAAADVRASSGLPLRTIVGVVGRDFGFLTFLRQQGVQWDVTGFHIYPLASQRSLLSDAWYGAGGPLAQLAAFGKPVRINEINCGEIYQPDYGTPSSIETCLRGLARHLNDLIAQQAAVIESVSFYALFDEPEEPAPENRFGLMQDIDHPKLHLFLATAFAGGQLTAGERQALDDLGLIAKPGAIAAACRRVLPQRAKPLGRRNACGSRAVPIAVAHGSPP